MKLLKALVLIFLSTCAIFGCKAPVSENQNSENNTGSEITYENIQVFYFHNTKRCATCNAVEEETKMALEMFYPEQREAGTIEFTSLNLEEEEGAKMAESLQVSGQTLLLVKGEKRVNLTNEGFMNARTNPGKFHEILQASIDQLL